MNQSSNKYYAIIPAAGRSARMGRQKLLLPWPSENQQRKEGTSDEPSTVLDAVLTAWHSSLVDEIVVVLRKAPEPAENTDFNRLAEICSRYRVHLAVVSNPKDMKASVHEGVRILTEEFGAKATDFCFISPADIPKINKNVINHFIQHPNTESQILVPSFGETRGHPTLFPFSTLATIDSIPADKGVNFLLNEKNQTLISFSESLYPSDIDTPQEYKDLLPGSDD